MVRYFGPGHTGTAETIFRLAVGRSPGRWDKSAISASERKFWDELRESLGDGSRSVENLSLDQMLPRRYDDELFERYCDVMEACEVLRISLDSGNIFANYRDENGVQHAVPVEFWRGDDECVITALLNGTAYLDVASNHELISNRLLRLPALELDKVWPELISRGLRESKGDETTEHGFDLPTDLAEVMSPLQGDAGPPKAERNGAATTPTKAKPTKVEALAEELRRRYPDGRRSKTIPELCKDLAGGEIGGFSLTTIKRALAVAWSDPGPDRTK
jgi:hypothetical protein